MQSSQLSPNAIPKTQTSASASKSSKMVSKKKPLTYYQQFIKDNRQKIKEQYPDLTHSELFTILATLWQKHNNRNQN